MARQISSPVFSSNGSGALCLLAICLLSACASRDKPTRLEPPQRGTLYDWYGEGLAGKPKVVINLATQRADVFIGGQPAGWAVVATGKEGHATPAGTYKITEKIEDKHSTLYGITVDAMGVTVNGDADARKDKPPEGGEFLYARMPYWMRITSYGIGLHAGIIPQPGSPASHGCIRLPTEFAPILFDVVKVGTPVTVIR